MGTRERADVVAVEVIHRLTALAHTAVSEGRTEEALGYLAAVLDRTSGAARTRSRPRTSTTMSSTRWRWRC